MDPNVFTQIQVFIVSKMLKEELVNTFALQMAWYSDHLDSVQTGWKSRSKFSIKMLFWIKLNVK